MTESADAPKTLYHYTTQSGLKGIVEKREVWATDIAYLNDSAEYRYAMNLLKAAVPQGGLDMELLPDLRKILERFESSNDEFPGVFVFSMSTDEDGLDLWRGYGGGDSGYALGLAKNELANLASTKKFQLVRCKYETAEHDQLIRQFIDELRVFCKKNGFTKEKAPLAEQRYQFNMYFFNAWGLVAARLKNPKFRNELEWRLVSQFHNFAESPKIECRTGRSTLIPYVKLTIAGVPFHRLTVGPTIDPVRARTR